MGSFASVRPATLFPRITFEQLEERIVLDGATDDLSCRADLFSAQVGATHTDSDQSITEAVLAESGTDVDSLVLETGTEWLQDGTWHYWERDWGGDGNGYEFHSWQDGSSSFHQIQWDAATNSKGTHNGFDYNLQRDGSWTYQAVQWDENQNGYDYNATSTGVYTYHANQWSDGTGYSYASDSNSQWTYHVIEAGNAEGDEVNYWADSGGFWHYTYAWANGITWTDGSENYPYLVKDINPAGNSSPEQLIDVNGTLYFFVNGEGAFQCGLWKTDGTAAGTVLLVSGGLDTNFYSDPYSSLHTLAHVNNTVYFSHSDAQHGAELWKTDGTVSGTTMVKDINPQGVTDTFSSTPRLMTNINGTLYFIADDGTHGSELWKSDGTASGTVMAKDIRAGEYGSNIGAQSNFGPANRYAFSNMNGTLYFSANDGIHGQELWKSDGTPEGTVMVKDINPGPDGMCIGGVADPVSEYVTVGNTLYFIANDGTHGYELWKTDGTELGTAMVMDTCPGWLDGGILYLTNLNGILYFRGYDTATEDYALWKTDGTTATILHNPYFIEGLENRIEWDPEALGNINGALYFWGSCSVHGMEPCKSNGTEEGTYMVRNIAYDDFSGSYIEGTGWMAGVNDKVYFSAWAELDGQELWRTDGTEQGTVEVANLRPGFDSSDPYNLINVNGTLYFTADDGIHGVELWAMKAGGSVSI